MWKYWKSCKNNVNIVEDGREGESCQMVLSNVRPNDPLTAELTRLTVRLPLSSLSRSQTYLFVCNLSEVWTMCFEFFTFLEIVSYQQVHKYFKSIDQSPLKIKKYSLVEEDVVLRTGAQWLSDAVHVPLLFVHFSIWHSRLWFFSVFFRLRLYFLYKNLNV